MNTKKPSPKLSTIALATATACMALSSSPAVYAQSKNAASETQTLNRVTVTGSNIKRTDLETSQPLLVLNKDEIKASGALTVGDVLANLSSNDRSAISDLGGANSWASGASGVSLRNLGTGGTLTLLNGRRLASYGFADGLQLNFTNIDAIPANIIERVEVLKDGASAIYGSDAIGGVINVITVKDFTGVGLQLSAQRNLKKSFLDADQQASVTVGHGNLASDGYNAYAHLEVYKRGSYKDSAVRDLLPDWYLEQNPSRGQRSAGSFPGNYTGSYPADYKDPALAGTRINTPAPGCAPENLIGGVCQYDYWKDSDARPATKRVTLLAGARMTINKDLSAFAEFQGADIQADYYTNIPRSNPGSVSTWYDSLKGELQSFTDPRLPANHPNNPYGFPIGLNYRFVDHPDMFKNIGASRDFRLLAGIEGSAWGWDFDGAVGLMRSHASQRQHLYKDRFGYEEAITSGAYKFGQTNPRELLEKMFPEMGSSGTYTQQFADAKGSREIGRLTGGPIMLALGSELRHETFEHRSMDNILQARIVGFSGVDISGKRDVAALFGEVNLPFTKQIEATLALRGDKVFDGFGAVTPKMQLAWRPMRELMLRGTVTQGFRAPSLPETGNGGASWFNNGYVDPKRCDTAKSMQAVLKTGNASDKLDATEVYNSGCSVSFPSAITPNSNLKPESSNNFSFGIVTQPMDNVSFTLDYYSIKRRDEIGTRDVNEVLANEDANPSLLPRDAVSARDKDLAKRVKELSGKDIAFAVGSVRSLGLQYQNMNKTKVSGLDLDLRSRWKLGAWGQLDAGIEANYQIEARYWDTTAQDYTENRVGYRGTPRLHAIYKINWSMADWKLGARLNQYSGTRLSAADWDSNNSIEGCAERDVAEADCRIKPWLSTDLWLQYSGFKNFILSANLLNAFDQKPLVELRPGSSLPLGGRVLKLNLEARF
ncbi:TonB-dependent receptor [Paucibacter sp. DJ1R-11]|uniref:TonB-dependent receptor plug domain-containing protein n=1 Tax=Paucibacter sp. DJ1R-11 TaxID=2893556 RepID=UPI0021E4562D|nr:TonB-dependent receptor [Paucibacter sp. DJ1R-11]MCV2362455.1 TonB-dependent receptor [Paucibacter sp. DJ1R-11]